MAREFFKNLPDTSTPLTASRINGLLNGEEAMGSIAVEDITSKQLFDKTNYIKGYLVSEITGELAANASYGVTHYIPVKANVNYYQQGTSYWYSVFCDENYNFLSQIGTKSFVPTQDGYMRASFLLSDIDEVQVAVGTEETEVSEYKKFGYNSQESMGKIVVDDISCKNKFNFSNIITSNGVLDYTNRIITLTKNANRTTNTLKEICPELKAGDNCTLSFVTTARGGDSTHPTNIIYLTGSTFRWENGTSHIITESELNGTIYFYGSYGDYAGETTTVSEIQIELGDKATPYTPYKNFNAPFFQDLTSEIVYNSAITAADKQFHLYKYGNVMFLQGFMSGISVTAGTTLFTIPTKYITVGSYDALRFGFISGTGVIYVAINPDGTFVPKTDVTWIGGNGTWIIKGDVTANTSSVSTTSLEEGE